MGDTTYSKGDITFSIEKSKFERVISPIQIGDITYIRIGDITNSKAE